MPDGFGVIHVCLHDVDVKMHARLRHPQYLLHNFTPALLLQGIEAQVQSPGSHSP